MSVVTLRLRVWNQKAWKCLLLEWNNLWEHKKNGPIKDKEPNPQTHSSILTILVQFNYPTNFLTYKFPSRPFFSRSGPLWVTAFNPIPFGDQKMPRPTLRALERMSAKTWKALHLLLCWKGGLGFFKKRMLHTWCLIERKPNCVDCWFWPSWCSFLIFVDCWFFNQIRAIFWSCHSWMKLVGDGGQLVCKKQEPKKWEKHVFIICLSIFFFRLSLKKSGGCLRCAFISLPKKEQLCRGRGSSTVFLGSWEFYQKGIDVGASPSNSATKKVTSCWS